MKNFLGIALSITFLFTSFAAIYGQGPDEYWIGLEEYEVHTNGDLEGMTTWRMYLHMLDEDDYLSACTGSESHPFILESTSTPAWYQHPEASETFATGINTAFFTAFPDLEYDSWFTIGVEDASIDMEVLSLADPTYDAFAAFEAGENVYSDTPVGNGWATLYPGLGTENPGFAGEDLRVLIGQITTAGTLSGSIYVQIFPWGVQDPDLRLLLPILYTPVQCQDETACNYDANAWTNEECEYGPSAGVIEGPQGINLNDINTTEWSYSCSDEASSFEWTITGGTILSGQGTSFVTVAWTTEGVESGESASISVTAISADGCSGTTSTLEIDILMGLEGLTFSDNLNIFPSPASSNITITLDGIKGNNRCQIYSLTGKKVLEFVLENNTRTLDVSNLANGTYILAVNTDQGALKQAFVIAK
tara:strand:- start:1092 stop:2351 length:1260 start_codon:yes stop_codon:yes gene_type:complete